MDQLSLNLSIPKTILQSAIAGSNSVNTNVMTSGQTSKNMVAVVEKRLQFFTQSLHQYSNPQSVPAADIQQMLLEIPTLQQKLTEAGALIAQVQPRIHNHLSALRSALEAVAGCSPKVELELSSAVTFFDSLLPDCNKIESSSRSVYHQLHEIHDQLLPASTQQMDITG